MTGRPVYWFPAKRYGYGWGLPRVWQGWVVMAVFSSLVLAGAFLLLPEYGPSVFVTYWMCLCFALVVICWIKGEPATWRWGRK